VKAQLEVSGLAKVYPGPGGELGVLSNVDFMLEAGHGAAITGPSGSGKSSLL
jgi:ABC-type lipoprotein export system ATPase subunit